LSGPNSTKFEKTGQSSALSMQFQISDVLFRFENEARFKF